MLLYLSRATAMNITLYLAGDLAKPPHERPGISGEKSRYISFPFSRWELYRSSLFSIVSVLFLMISESHNIWAGPQFLSDFESPWLIALGPVPATAIK